MRQNYVGARALARTARVPAAIIHIGAIIFCVDRRRSVACAAVPSLLAQSSEITGPGAAKRNMRR
jgi:hypothetical protein